MATAVRWGGDVGGKNEVPAKKGTTTSEPKRSEFLKKE